MARTKHASVRLIESCTQPSESGSVAVADQINALLFAYAGFVIDTIRSGFSVSIGHERPPRWGSCDRSEGNAYPLKTFPEPCPRGALVRGGKHLSPGSTLGYLSSIVGIIGKAIRYQHKETHLFTKGDSENELGLTTASQ